MAARRAQAPQLREERPGLVEVFDDVPADDPVELLPNECDDLPGVTVVDVIDALSCDGRGLRIELDAHDPALLPRLQSSAEGSFTAAEFEDRLRVRRNARKEVLPGL